MDRWIARGAAAALLVAAAAIAQTKDVPRIVTLQVCIDGLDNLHVKDGRLSWEHLAFEAPGKHGGCKGVTQVDGAPWDDWSRSLPLPVASDFRNMVFHPVVCRGNCVLVQTPSTANGWEAIYQLDDYVLGGPAAYCLKIVIGGPPESAADQSVQHVTPAPRSAGGRPLFTGVGGTLRDGTCSQDVVS